MDIKDLNPDIIERAKACKSSEELVALATEQGVRRIYLFVMGLLPLISLYNCVVNLLALG